MTTEQTRHPLNDAELRRLFDDWARLANAEKSPSRLDLIRARQAFINRVYDLLDMFEPVPAAPAKETSRQ